MVHGRLRVTLGVAYRAGGGGAMLFHQAGWDPVRVIGLGFTLTLSICRLLVLFSLQL